MTDAYRWELIDTLRSAKLADLLATVPEVNQRTFIDAAQLLEEVVRLVKRNIELETALDKIEAICKHGPE